MNIRTVASLVVVGAVGMCIATPAAHAQVTSPLEAVETAQKQFKGAIGDMPFNNSIVLEVRMGPQLDKGVVDGCGLAPVRFLRMVGDVTYSKNTATEKGKQIVSRIKKIVCTRSGAIPKPEAGDDFLPADIRAPELNGDTLTFYFVARGRSEDDAMMNGGPGWNYATFLKFQAREKLSAACENGRRPNGSCKVAVPRQYCTREENPEGRCLRSRPRLGGGTLCERHELNKTATCRTVYDYK